MKNLLPTFVFLLCILLIVSCKQKEPAKLSESSKKEVILSKFAKNYPDYSPKRLREVIHDIIQKDSLLLPFYTENEYFPVWAHDTLDTQRLQNLIAILNKSKDHGLSPDYFATSQIQSLTDSIDSGLYKNDLEYLYVKMADLELLSTRMAVKYVTGMSYGFTDPKKLFKKDYDISVFTPDSTFYTELYKGLRENPLSIVENSHPADPLYQILIDEYLDLEHKLQDSEFKTINGASTYKVGDKNKHISEIAHRLMLTGEYKPDTDSIYSDSLHQILDKRLLAAVNTFRRKNSYPEENEVGKLTIDALNRPLNYYQTKLRANMERYRWRRTKAKHNKHIEVNVASAMLYANQKDSLPLIMKICVGSMSNKTPLLQSDISYLNLNPIWNVPTSIARNEVAVRQKKDPTYIKRNNMKLYKGGKEVDLTSVDWSEVDPSKFSYSIKQDPGTGNSLGLIKFMFNNAFSVYLHDTPSKSRFNLKNRAISHGCVRLQKPFDLAFFCMSMASNDLYKDRLYYSINMPPLSAEGKKLLQENKLKKLPNILNPEDKISLFIDYYTAYTYPNDDMLYYADDTYGYDQIILDALDSNKL